MEIKIHEEKISHFTFHEKKKGPITSQENTLYHPLVCFEYSKGRQGKSSAILIKCNHVSIGLLSTRP